jgi:hypothetical protein
MERWNKLPPPSPNPQPHPQPLTCGPDFCYNGSSAARPLTRRAERMLCES